MSDAMNRIVNEARRDGGPNDGLPVDWGRVDEQLFARIAELQRAERRSLVPARGGAWKAAVAGLALAAGVGVVMGKMRDHRALETNGLVAPDGAGSIVAIEGDGQVLVGAKPAVVGEPLQLGDVIETPGAQATVSRSGRVVVLIERGSSAAVTRVQGTLVLALARGAVEAQVVPVSNGEAFAVDVGPSRVAVHGTHFRVAREGDRVIVDLSEGVVSVGDAPRVGSTLGGLVTAPAHAEFMVSDPQKSLRMTHDSSAIRGPVVLFGQSNQSKLGTSSLVAAHAQTAAERADSAEVSPPSGVGARAERHPTASAPGPSPAMPPADPNAQDTVANAVRACMAERLHAEDVTVVVSTTLFLRVHDDGMVRSAHFDPPVAPDVNTCAAQSIYKTRFAHPGDLTIPISVKN